MPKNSLDRLRYLVLLKDETTIRDLGVEQKDASPTRNELKELEYSYCYLHHSVEDPKGWRNDGFRASWDCKSHWSYPMRGKLRRKIDKITIDSSRELHRWATQLNTVPQNPAAPPAQTLTLVEYFMKSKSKQLPITKSPFGASSSASLDKISKLSESVGDKEPKRKSASSSTSVPPTAATMHSHPHPHQHQGNSSDNMLALLNYEATKELSHHGIPGDFQGAVKNNVRPMMAPNPAMPPPGAEWNYYRSLTPTYDYNPMVAAAPYMQFRPIPEAFTPPYSTTPIPTASPTLPTSSISPMDWNAWQNTLHSWAIYLDGLPQSDRAMIWNYCRNSPHFQAYDVDSFVGLWHKWSQSFHTNAPAISVFCSALDAFRNLFPDWRQPPATVGGYGDQSLPDRRAKVMDVSSLVM